MKGRDLLILGAVVLVAGLAVADAIRSQGSGQRLTTATEPRPTTTTGFVPELNENLGRTRMPPVEGAEGSIVLTEVGACPVREFQVATGDELPNVVQRSTCELWAAPTSARVAVGIGPPSGDATPFRFVDLARPQRDLGSSTAAFGFLLWSADGRRAAWCNRRRVGIDLEVGRRKHRLEGCPAAYTQEGEVAYAVGNRLVAGSQVVLRALGAITQARFGADRSVAVVVEGRMIERFEGGRVQQVLELVGELEGRSPILSPDNCAAAFRVEDEIRVADVGCSPWGDFAVSGTAATWSPDGQWLAVADGDTLSFYFLPDRRVVRWDVAAEELAWRG